MECAVTPHSEYVTKTTNERSKEMTRLTKTLGIALLIATLAVPVFAFAYDWGRGHHMVGPWGRGGYYERDYGNITEEQRGRLAELDRKFYDETANLRNEVWTKSGELNVLLNSPNPDLEKAKALQKEISDLRTMLDEKRLSYELEVRKIDPDLRFGRGYGRGYYGHHMEGYGPGMGSGWHRGGYGFGTCWK
jgi:Spy/CpxP family protein refolding chaperone